MKRYEVKYERGGSMYDKFDTIEEVAKHLKKYGESNEYGEAKVYEITTEEIGLVKFWWMSSKSGVKENKEQLCTTVLDALWMYHCQALIEVDNENIDFNTGGVMRYDSDFFIEDVSEMDGFVDLHTDEGVDVTEILDEVYNKHCEEDDQYWTHLTKQQIKDYIINNDIKAKIDSIRMY